ncbi:PadR family transcriptional regulator [Halorussus halobius]|uniref:PadR family transcriptional regulator n=1 Tax=Halorussus halobius TaxID=1710537 RepID=UPI001092350D|nr:PadR family transcriptional regulator [Halorussus halobius]
MTAVHADDLTRFQHDLLVVIAGYEHGRYRDDRHTGSRPHGLALKDTLDARYDAEVHHGRLYPNLDTLVDKGLVEKQERDQRTNVYSLTDQGWALLDQRVQWLLNCLDGDTGGGE